MKDNYIYPDRMYKTLFGTSAKGSRLIGYCWYHKKYITIKQQRQQHCLAKHCDAMERFKWHAFWKNREKRKNNGG